VTHAQRSALGKHPRAVKRSVSQGELHREYSVSLTLKSAIDPLSEIGETLPSVEGKFSFRSVKFNYKSREAEGGEAVLKNLNLDVMPGSTCALVGPSGCGKSSTIGLLERFYYRRRGQVTLDGVDLRELNVRWLRAQIGHVGQMPTLFRASIRENIDFGAAVDVFAGGDDGKAEASGTFARRQVTEHEIIAAARLANAHAFITKLPEGYDTMLGERGALLSGGQKQRICIARAVVRNPKLLLLDEATSALDVQSERAVQEALEKASEGRTTILIAHRLSTVRNAGMTSVFRYGEIVESGCHEELIRKHGGAYHELIKMQEVHRETTKVLGGDDRDDLSKQYAASNAQGATKSAEESVIAVDGVEAPAEEKTCSVDRGVIARMFEVNRGEWPFILLGVIGAGLAGACWPLRALVFSEVTSLLGDPTKAGEISF
jgi:ABC-type multidrug transport system fused ATPase/permease subunit